MHTYVTYDLLITMIVVEWLARYSADEHKGSAHILSLLRRDFPLLFGPSSTYEEYRDFELLGDDPK
jgi:hypothetical protein